jgi:UDP-N-acetylmuramyl pentapeptide phosphotransferase/UDP-N-acetylglucosamine-1-phosphate transferase
VNTLVGAVVMGGVAVFLSFQGVRSVLSGRTRHLKENYRGVTLIATAGLVLLFPAGLGVGAATATVEDGRSDAFIIGAATLVMAILGFVDDLYGSRRAGGLLGHARELVHGRVTTGLVKAVGGALVGLVAAFALGSRGIWIVIAGATIAMAANMANLLDLRPARTVKVFIPLSVGLCVAVGSTPATRMVAATAGGALVFAYWELQEKVMLGDVGANLLGTVLGAAAVASFSERAVAITAAVLLVLTLIAERVSFSGVIAAVPPLRWLDQLGRIRTGGAGGRGAHQPPT